MFSNKQIINISVITCFTYLVLKTEYVVIICHKYVVSICHKYVVIICHKYVVSICHKYFCCLCKFMNKTQCAEKLLMLL
jgi:hypothetical protein